MELHILNEDTLKEEINKVKNEVLNLKTDTETSGEDDSGDDTSGDEDSEAWTMFMAHLNHTEFDELENQLKKAGCYYLIAFEHHPYDHFHFMVKFTKQEYHKFCKRVFIDKYKLRGRCSNGMPKQYGHMRKKIECLDKIAKYTIKDKNYRTNLSKKS